MSDYTTEHRNTSRTPSEGLCSVWHVQHLRLLGQKEPTCISSPQTQMYMANLNDTASQFDQIMPDACIFGCIVPCELNPLITFGQEVERGIPETATEDVLKNRRILKARRGSAAPPPTPTAGAPAATAAANPFAGISILRTLDATAAEQAMPLSTAGQA